MSADIVEWEEVDEESVVRFERALKALGNAMKLLADLVDEHETSIKTLQRLVGKLAALELERQSKGKSKSANEDDCMFA